MDVHRILLLVDLKPRETLNDLDDIQMIRTIGAFKSSFPNSIVEFIPISELPKYAQSNQTFINDAYIMGHGDFSTLGSGLSVDQCGQIFKEALLVPGFNINHIHLTCCHSAEKDILGSNKSLLFAVHENLSQVSDKSVLITGYRNQIHLVRTESLTCGEFKLDVKMPYAPIIHRGLQPLRKYNDCETLTGYVFKDLLSFSNYYHTGKMPEKTGPVFDMFQKFISTLHDTGKDGPFYKEAELNYAVLESKIEKFETSLEEFKSTNNITIDKPTKLSDEFIDLDLKQLKEKLNELSAKKNDMNPEELNMRFNQIYFAYQTLKQNLKIDEGKFFNTARKALFKDLRDHLMKMTKSEGTRNESKVKYFCGKTIHYLKDIYFDNLEIGLEKKIEISRELDKMSVLFPTDTLNVQEFYLAKPEFEYTCQSDKKFPEIIFFSPTIDWEKGFWKDMLDNMQYFKDDEVEHGLNYICDAFEDFKKNSNLDAMKEILTILPVKLSAFLKECQNGEDRLFHLHKIIALIDDNKEIIKQLDKQTLTDWIQLLEHDLPNKKYLGSNTERVRKGDLAFVNLCLQPENTPKNTSFILSSLARSSNTDIKSLSVEKESPRNEETKVTREETQPTTPPPTNPNPQPQVTDVSITSTVEKTSEPTNKYRS